MQKRAVPAQPGGAQEGKENRKGPTAKPVASVGKPKDSGLDATQKAPVSRSLRDVVMAGKRVKPAPIVVVDHFPSLGNATQSAHALQGSGSKPHGPLAAWSGSAGGAATGGRGPSSLSYAALLRQQAQESKVISIVWHNRALANLCMLLVSLDR
jgi:hypothetical protein